MILTDDNNDESVLWSMELFWEKMDKQTWPVKSHLLSLGVLFFFLTENLFQTFSGFHKSSFPIKLKVFKE